MTNMIISDGGEVNTHTDNCCSWKKKNKTRGRRRDEVRNPVLFKLEEEQQDDTWPKTKEVFYEFDIGSKGYLMIISCRC
jgi:hypothetical protein